MCEQGKLFFAHVAILVLTVLFLQPVNRVWSAFAWRFLMQLCALTSAYKVRAPPKAPALSNFICLLPGPLQACKAWLCVSFQWRAGTVYNPCSIPIKPICIVHHCQAAWGRITTDESLQVYLKYGLPKLRPFPGAIKAWVQPASAASDFQYLILAALFINAPRPMFSVRALSHAAAWHMGRLFPHLPCPHCL